MQGIIRATDRLQQVAQQFANIAAGHPEYNKYGNAWDVPAAGWDITL